LTEYDHADYGKKQAYTESYTTATEAPL